MPSSKSKGKVLIVDDEADLREVFADSLRMEGYTVTLAASGGEAMSRVKDTGPFDAVITDISMQNGSGIDLAESIRRVKGPAPVIVFITGHSDFTEADAHQMGASTFFPKPVDLDKLIDFLHQEIKPRAARVSETRINTRLKVKIPAGDTRGRFELVLDEGGAITEHVFRLPPQTLNSKDGMVDLCDLTLSPDEVSSLFAILSKVSPP